MKSLSFLFFVGPINEKLKNFTRGIDTMFKKKSI